MLVVMWIPACRQNKRMRILQRPVCDPGEDVLQLRLVVLRQQLVVLRLVFVHILFVLVVQQLVYYHKHNLFLLEV